MFSIPMATAGNYPSPKKTNRNDAASSNCSISSSRSNVIADESLNDLNFLNGLDVSNCYLARLAGLTLGDLRLRVVTGSYLSEMPSSFCASLKIERSATSLTETSRSTLPIRFASSIARWSPFSGKLPS